jgi:hypothetical protein
MSKFTICIALYNLIRIHTSVNKHLNVSIVRVKKVLMTPPMAAGVTDHVWSYSEVIEKNIHVL